MKKRRLFYRKLLASAVVGASAATASGALIAADEENIEEIAVVGSRITRNAEFETATPIQVVDREAIENSGYTNLQQLFEKHPAAGNGTFSTRGNNQDSSANGAAAVSLRGMGADATLVLVNGRRVATSAFAENITNNFVDINSIPLAAVERVEVLKDGASALYGSDAVAGVVNLVLRKDFDGAEVTVDYGGADSYDQQSLSAIWGLNGEDGNITVIFDHHTNSTLANSDRKWLDQANQSARGGNDNRSSRGYPGTFLVDGKPVVDPDCPPGSIVEDICRYEYGPWVLLTPEAERTGMLLLGHKQFNESIEFFTEVTVQHNTSIAQGAPTPIDGEANLIVPEDHPNNPFGREVGIEYYRTVDAGPRQWNIESNTLRGLFGLRGSVADWDWEASIQRSRNESTQTGDLSQGWVRTDKLQAEIDAGRYNPFGGVQNPQSVIDAIGTSLVRRGKSQFSSMDFTLSGELFDTRNGAVAMAVGLEYRKEKVEDIPDDQFQRDLIVGTEAVAASGGRDITSAFVEFGVPLLANLDLTLAGRYDDYSDFGSTTNPMVNLLWSVNDMLSLRASWGTGFRAPSLAQIGLGPSEESIFFADQYRCQDQGISADDCEEKFRNDYNVAFVGNPDLEAEESESYNIGAVFKPFEALQLSLDLWQITQENKIDRESREYLYSRYCNDQSSTICERDPAFPGATFGQLRKIHSSFINIGEQEASGVDLSAVYTGMPLWGGELGLRLDYAWLGKFNRVEQGGDDGSLRTRELTGEYEYPQHRWTGTADWNLADFGLSASFNYIGEFEDTLEYEENTREVDAFMTLNLQARYSGFEQMTMSIGIDNVLDEEVPFAIGDGDADIYGYASSLHDPLGRFVYGKLTYRF
ncbi:MAG: TonB-dependent receptor [Gammaproteobacteria bacterium]|nr:TonB-dependent receptor [Gammaproteobacteria bacterium]